MKSIQKPDYGCQVNWSMQHHLSIYQMGYVNPAQTIILKCD
jgi:hypothetical protein